jgi:hypothetical protein
LREEAGREKAQKERKAAEKAEQEILKRAERAEQARKGKEARKLQQSGGETLEEREAYCCYGSQGLQQPKRRASTGLLCVCA